MATWFLLTTTSLAGEGVFDARCPPGISLRAVNQKLRRDESEYISPDLLHRVPMCHKWRESWRDEKAVKLTLRAAPKWG